MSDIHNQIDGTGTSNLLMILTIFANLFASSSLSTISLIVAILAGVTTIIYNVSRIVKEIKKTNKE